MLLSVPSIKRLIGHSNLQLTKQNIGNFKTLWQRAVDSIYSMGHKSQMGFLWNFL